MSKPRAEQKPPTVTTPQGQPFCKADTPAPLIGPLPALTPGTLCHDLLLHLYDCHLGNTSWGYFYLIAEQPFRTLEHLRYVTNDRPFFDGTFTPHGLNLARDEYTRHVTDEHAKFRSGLLFLPERTT